MRFSQSNRNMVESMSATADRIGEYAIKYGMDTVESFIDAVLAILEHIDPSLIRQDQPGNSRFVEGRPK
ncbi:hypothetical protein PUR_18380 [Paenibacillus sp. URB8-2]|nr:hypothetical protein PUR_18380 [Paenibacillus sp. URB8-2]